MYCQSNRLFFLFSLWMGDGTRMHTCTGLGTLPQYLLRTPYLPIRYSMRGAATRDDQHHDCYFRDPALLKTQPIPKLKAVDFFLGQHHATTPSHPLSVLAVVLAHMIIYLLCDTRLPSILDELDTSGIKIG
ncbi:hypothetical protein F4802DRAFT_581134 [Xylaria palmicola]|nr:hypothetical protein F4802DRAFT_581134 [Xylaria palmicola]